MNTTAHRNKADLAAALATRACVNCQKRKSRCARSSIAGEPCAYCARAGKPCSFQEPPRRTALTRDNLSAAQTEVLRLRRLVRTLQPGIDLDAALLHLPAAGTPTPHGVPYGGEGGASASAAASTPPTTTTAAGNISGSDAARPSRETDPWEPWREQRHGFEWREGPDSPAIDHDGTSPASREDGMALFPTGNSGYLGSSSGSDLIKDIAPFLPPPQAPSPSSSRQPGDQAVPARLSRDLLASPTFQNRLVDAYFLYYNSSYPILHEETFRDQLVGKHKLPPTATWHVLHYMVLAIGHWISMTNESGDLSPYYSAARARLTIQVLESGSMTTVQAFLLMGNYLQKNDRPNTGYNFVGIAHRMALGLGLHREPPEARNDLLQERRRQLFWVLFCFDCGFNITTGRPPSMYEGFVDCRLPQNIDDREIALSTSIPQVVSVPTTYSALIAQAPLAKMSNAIYTEFLQAKTAGTKIEYQVAEAMELQLQQWRQSLPDYFTSPEVPSWFLGPRSVVLWKEQNLRILLWRGSKPRHGFLAHKIDAETRCRNVAMQTIHDIASFCARHPEVLHLGVTWYATYFLFQAALVLETGLIRGDVPTPGQHQSFDSPNSIGGDHGALEISITTARNCLATLGPNNISAKRCQELLERVHELLNHIRYSSTQGQMTGQQLPMQHSPNNKHLSNMLGPVPSEAVFVPSPSPPGPFSHLDFGAADEFHLGFGDFAADHTLRMLIDQTTLGVFDQAPLADIFRTEHPGP
ncbi:transcriptional regulatory protein GAL4 [Microdochium nivale]|nr:transcriptional regulatory protein GAL4 [Microdochium nivale]